MRLTFESSSEFWSAEPCPSCEGGVWGEGGVWCEGGASGDNGRDPDDPGDRGVGSGGTRRRSDDSGCPCLRIAIGDGTWK